MADQMPFTRDYVLSATVKHCVRSIDISIRKTHARWKEFQEDPVKQKEIMVTLMELHDMRKIVEDLHSNKDS